MYTLIYHNNHFNRPDTLPAFLQSNIGKYSTIQIDCVTPYQGTKAELTKDVCDYLSGIDPTLHVTPNITPETRTETNGKDVLVNYLVLQIQISEK